MDGNGAGDICGTTVWNKRVFFWMRWLQRSCIFIGDFLGSTVTLVCLMQSTRVSFMGYEVARNSFFFCFRSKRVDRCVGVEHEEYLETVDLTSYVGTIPTWLASYFLV